MAANVLRRYDRAAATAIRVTLGLLGLIGMVSGLFILAWPDRSAVAVGAVLAGYAGITGLINLAMGIFASHMRISSRIGYGVLGGAFVAASVAAFINLGPFMQTWGPIVGILIGAVWIVNGVIMIAVLNDVSVRVSTVLHGVVNIAAGVLLMTAPLHDTQALALLAGGILLTLGSLQTWRAWRFARPPMMAARARPIRGLAAQ